MNRYEQIIQDFKQDTKQDECDPVLPIDYERYYYAVAQIREVNITGTNPGEHLLIEFKVTTSMNMIAGTYDPEDDSFKFHYNGRVPPSIIPAIKDKLLQEIGHELNK